MTLFLAYSFILLLNKAGRKTLFIINLKEYQFGKETIVFFLGKTEILWKETEKQEHMKINLATYSKIPTKQLKLRRLKID